MKLLEVLVRILSFKATESRQEMNHTCLKLIAVVDPSLEPLTL